MDSTLLNAAREISDDYADVVSVAARQAMASVEITVSESSDGGWNTSDIMSFMKDVGGSRWVYVVHLKRLTLIVGLAAQIP